MNREPREWTLSGEYKYTRGTIVDPPNDLEGDETVRVVESSALDALRAELAEVRKAFNGFAVQVMAESIAAVSDAAIVGHGPYTEANSLAWMRRAFADLARVTAERDKLREALDALVNLSSVPQNCDGGGSFMRAHFDAEGNEVGYDSEQCAGCCACAAVNASAALAASKEGGA